PASGLFRARRPVMAIGKIYAAPTIDRTAPDQRAARWDEVKDIKVAFQDEPSKDSKTFGYWFNYLWEEARQAADLTQGDKGRLCDAFFSVLDLNAAGTTTPKAELAQMSPEQKRKVLTTLLTIGF